ncbi:MAG TPA: hypothetical protein DCW90_08575 [Lachnospiraceae bacterium]|nr:hypothetical protein [Lachnospiraceae bacterium]
MNGIVNHLHIVEEWREFDGTNYYLYILPVGTIFQTYAIYGYSPIIYFEVKVPTNKTLTFARNLVSSMTFTWGSSEKTNFTDETMRYDSGTGKYFVRFNNTSPMPVGTNFTVTSQPFIAVLQAS